MNTDASKTSSSKSTDEISSKKSPAIGDYEKCNLLRIDNYKSVRDYLFKKIDSHVGGDSTAKFKAAFGEPTFIYKIGKAEYPTWKHEFKGRTFYVFTGTNGTSYECANAKFDSKEDETISVEFLKEKITTALEGNENGKADVIKDQPK